MRQQRFHLAVLTAATGLLLAAQAQAVVIQVGSVSGAAGSTQSLSVTLSSQGSMVAGTQNDIDFEAAAPINAVSGSPDCAVNPAINKGATAFSFLPSGCSGTACTGVRALVLSFSNTTAIPDGSVLYTCNIAIGASASGTLPLTCANAGASDPDGNALTTTCTNGSVTVGGGGPTPTPTTGGAATTIEIGSTSGNIGQSGLSIDVTLVTTEMVAGTQNDITFTSQVQIAANNGSPDCTVNSAINKGATAFSFLPSGCSGAACTGVRALVLSFSNTTPIPTGSVLYTCNIDITSSAENGQSYALTCANAGASDPNGNALAANCTNGSVAVGGGTPGATGTPTATPTPSTGGGPTHTPTVTGKATATNTPGGAATPTSGFQFKNDDDACAIVPPADSHFGWSVLLPAAVLLWLRRRSR